MITRYAVSFLIFFLAASMAKSQTQETFGNYVNGLPSATAPTSSDQLYLRQGGVSKQLSVGGFPIISGTTPCSGCAANSVLASVGSVIIGDVGLTYASNGGQIQLNQFGILTSPAAATWQFGAIDNATPVAQTLKFQDGAGADISGVNATIIASLNTGSGTPGNLLFQTGAVGSSGAVQATPVTRFLVGPSAIQAFVPIGGIASGFGSTSAFQVVSTSPSYAWQVSDQTPDEKEWDAVAVGKVLYFRAVNDPTVNNNANTWVQVTRSGFVITNVAFPAHIASVAPVAKPTVATCGTGTVANGSTDTVGQVTATGATACTLSFQTAYTSQPFCTVTDNTTAAALRLAYVAATGFTVSGLTSGDTFSYFCMAQSGG